MVTNTSDMIKCKFGSYRVECKQNNQTRKRMFKYVQVQVQVQVKFIITHAGVKIISAVSRYIETVIQPYKYIKYISLSI